MHTWDLLIRITKPGSLQLCERLPETLLSEGNAAKGGFRPLGMWDCWYDARSFEWIGIIFYLSESEATKLGASVSSFDDVLVKVTPIALASLNASDKEQLSRNSCSHVLEILWSDAEYKEVMPALEFCDFWYATGCSAESVEYQDGLYADRQLVALGIINASAKLDIYNLKWPTSFSVPTDIR